MRILRVLELLTADVKQRVWIADAYYLAARQPGAEHHGGGPGWHCGILLRRPTIADRRSANAHGIPAVAGAERAKGSTPA